MTTYQERIQQAVGIAPLAVIAATEARMREIAGTLDGLRASKFEALAQRAYREVVLGIGTPSGRHDLFPGARN